MKKSRFTEEQIAYAQRRADSGTPVVDVEVPKRFEDCACSSMGESTISDEAGRLDVRSHRADHLEQEDRMAFEMLGVSPSDYHECGAREIRGERTSDAPTRKAGAAFHQ